MTVKVLVESGNNSPTVYIAESKDVKDGLLLLNSPIKEPLLDGNETTEYSWLEIPLSRVVRIEPA